MKLPSQTGPIHFVGIGGIGMSGIAEAPINLGYKVQGSDLSDNASARRLRERGATVAVGHAKGESRRGRGPRSVEPILDGEPADAAELGCVGRDDCRPQATGVRGDQKIVRADRLPRGLQFSADVCIFSISGNIKREDPKRIEDRLDTREEPG